MSCSGTRRESVLLGDSENELVAQRERVSCSDPMRTSVLLRDNGNEFFAQGQAGRLFRRGQVLGKSVFKTSMHVCMIFHA